MSDIVYGDDLLALERFMDNTKHMIEFDVLTWEAPVGDKGTRVRVFLSDDGYEKAQKSEKRGEIKIRKHACVVKGNLLYDRKKEYSR